MTEWDECIWCPTCKTRAMFNVGSTGRVAICMDCGTEIEPTIELRCRAIHDCLFEFLATICPESNGLDK